MGKQKALIFSVLLIVVAACAPAEKSIKKEISIEDKIPEFKNEVNLNIGKNVSWVNLMPGSEPKFHISGKISLLKGSNYDMENTELRSVKVFQSGEELYYIIPKVVEQESDEAKNITYSTISGLSLRKELDTAKTVDLELFFYENGKELKYRLKNIAVDEVH